MTNRITDEETSVDLWLDLYQQFLRLYHVPNNIPNEKQIRQWMKRWPGGLNEDVRAIRNANKERIISLLIKKIENRHAPSSRYVFPEGINDEEKRQWVNQWWNEARFHLALAIKSLGSSKDGAVEGIEASLQKWDSLPSYSHSIS